MGLTPTLQNFSNTTPPAPPGNVNVKWQNTGYVLTTIEYQGESIQVMSRQDSGYVPAPGTGGSVVAVAKVPVAPASPGNFVVPHGLGFAPSFVVIEMESGGNIWLQTPAFDATNLYLVASDGGVSGVACLFLSGPDASVPLAPLSPGDFTVAHGLSSKPQLIVLQMTSGGAVWFQTPTGWDATNIYAVAADAGVTALAYCWLTVPIVAVSGYAQISLAPGAPGNFTVAHGLGQTPTMVLINMTSGGQIWLQESPPYDSTNLYLVASDGGITGNAEVWVG